VQEKNMRINNSAENSQKWIVLIAATGINFSMGLAYSWSVFKKALVDDWQWSNMEASLPLTAYTLVYAPCVILGGLLQDKLGPRLTATMGSCILLAGMIGAGFATTPLVMAITCGVMAATGYGFSHSSTTPTSVKWFPQKKRGFVTGIVVSGVGFAAVYVAPLTNWLLELKGISYAFFALGALSFTIIFSMAQFLKAPPPECVPATDELIRATSSCKANHNYEWYEMIKTPQFFKLWSMWALSASAGLIILGHIASISQKQANFENGFFLVMILAVANTFGRVAAGTLSDKFGRFKIMLLFFLLQAFNLICFANYITPMTLIVGVIITGLSYGAPFALFPAIVADLYGTKNMGVNYGIIMTGWGFAGLVGPILAGWIADVTGAYHYAYITCAILLSVSSLIVLSFKPYAK
jgi:OFA family oxalate/formate antiporter-like MFS transporter